MVPVTVPPLEEDFRPAPFAGLEKGLPWKQAGLPKPCRAGWTWKGETGRIKRLARLSAGELVFLKGQSRRDDEQR